MSGGRHTGGGGPMGGGQNSGRSLYPPMRRRFPRNAVRAWTLRGMAGALAVCALVNLGVGGRPWCLIVALGEAIAYAAFLARGAIERSWLERLVATAYMVCALLLVVGLWGPEMLETALPLTICGTLGVGAVVFAIEAARYRRNPLPLVHLVATSIAFALTGLLLPWGLNGPRIVLLAAAGVLVLVVAVWFRRLVWGELRKRFSVG